MAKTVESVRLFQNPALESLTHVDVLTPAFFWTPVLGFFIWDAIQFAGLSIPQWAVTLTAGLIFWTLAEYLLHRFVFHFKPFGPISERLVYLFHGNHHDVPNDKTRLVMPPVPAIILATPFFLGFLAIFGHRFGPVFFVGFILGYLIYDYTHYAVHHFTPRTEFGKKVKQHHMLHHYAKEGAKWGVSSPLWDRVFTTMEDPSDRRRRLAREQQKSEVHSIQSAEPSHPSESRL